MQGADGNLLEAHFLGTGWAFPPAFDSRTRGALMVSQLDDVKVEIGEKTTRGFEVAEEDGILTWKLPLGAKERKELELRFVVEIPSKYDASGL